MNGETAFQIGVAVVGSLLTVLCALAYFRRVRLERPPIGTFNTRDLCVLGVFIEDLQEFQLALEKADRKAIAEFFEKAKQRRDQWCAPGASSPE